MSAVPWQSVALEQTPAQAWRNGGGLTHELLAWPASDWRWRVSVARIERDGPFSHFPDTQRQFAVIRGTGVRLDIDGMPHTVRAGGAVLAFEGGQGCHCQLIDGPTLDFNLMSRHAVAHLHRWPAQGMLPWRAGQVAGIYACAAAHVQGPGGERFALASDELLWTPALPGGPWQVEGSDALVFAIEEHA